MDRESFLDTLRKQFAEEIQEAYLESKRREGKVDQDQLRMMLTRLSAQAALRGLPAKEFDELVSAVLPNSDKAA